MVWLSERSTDWLTNHRPIVWLTDWSINWAEWPLLIPPSISWYLPCHLPCYLPSSSMWSSVSHSLSTILAVIDWAKWPIPTSPDSPQLLLVIFHHLQSHPLYLVVFHHHWINELLNYLLTDHAGWPLKTSNLRILEKLMKTWGQKQV